MLGPLCKQSYVKKAIHIVSKGKYSCGQNNSSVFEKSSKAQDPHESFNFQVKDCTENSVQDIPNQTMTTIYPNDLYF